jgi:hypothetical protein
MHPTKIAMMRPAISIANKAPQTSMMMSTATQGTLSAAMAMLDRHRERRWNQWVGLPANPSPS